MWSQVDSNPVGNMKIMSVNSVTFEDQDNLFRPNLELGKHPCSCQEGRIGRRFPSRNFLPLSTDFSFRAFLPNSSCFYPHRPLKTFFKKCNGPEKLGAVVQLHKISFILAQRGGHKDTFQILKLPIFMNPLRHQSVPKGALLKADLNHRI